MRKLIRVGQCRVLATLGAGFLIFGLVALGRGQTPTGAYKALGTVVSIEPGGFTIQTDSGNRVTVLLGNSARLLRVAPNQKDLKTATKITAEEISVGDRILVLGHISEDQKTLDATAAIDMSKEAIARRQEAERLAWQKGVGGLVTSVDPAAGTVTISMAAPGAIKKIEIHVSKNTIVLRYAPDSIKFDDAKPGTLDQIKPGDQLRARGTHNEGGSEFAADEIVSGTFRNIAGTVASIDAGQHSITVTDLKTKKPVLVRFTADSQLRKLPPMVAQRIAARLKGEAGGGPPNRGGGTGGGAPGGAPPPATPAEGRPPGGGPGGPRPGGAPDLQQILERMAPATLADLQKGDAVMIVATEGTASGGVTAITALSGVEPILASSGSASQAMFMSSWNIGGGQGGEESGE